MKWQKNKISEGNRFPSAGRLAGDASDFRLPLRIPHRLCWISWPLHCPIFLGDDIIQFDRKIDDRKIKRKAWQIICSPVLFHFSVVHFFVYAAAVIFFCEFRTRAGFSGPTLFRN